VYESESQQKVVFLYRYLNIEVCRVT